MKKIVKLPDPSNPAHATLHSGESMQRDEAQKQLRKCHVMSFVTSRRFQYSGEACRSLCKTK